MSAVAEAFVLTSPHGVLDACPQSGSKSSAVWTLSVGILVILVWQFVPAVRIFPHVIYAEWPAALATFLLVAFCSKEKCDIPKNFAKTPE